MKLWSPIRRRKRDPITKALDDAAARNAKNAQRSDQAHDQVDAAVKAEQDQLRRNHLGDLLHDALTTRRRFP